MRTSCLEIEPNEKGKGNEIVSKIVGGVIPKEYITPVIKGIEEGLSNRRSRWLSPRRCQSRDRLRILPRSRLERDGV